MRILLKYPTRSRPTQFQAALSAYVNMATGPLRIVVSIDEDDGSMRSPQLSAWMKAMGCDVHTGPRGRSKVQAINADIPADAWDILVLASDDHMPVLQGWDDRIVADFAELAPKGEPCILWYKDVRQDRICFMPTFNRAAYDHFGYIYHPSYVSLWCDNEQTEVGMASGMMKRVDVEVFRNESPDWGGSVKRDPLYVRNNRTFAHDKRTFQRRKAQGFPK